MSTEAKLDPDRLNAMVRTVWSYRQGEMVALMMHFGDRLGIYPAMKGLGPVTAGELAEITGLHERWLQEWLMSQAAADLVESEDGLAFELTREGAAVLADRDSLTFAGSAMGGPQPTHVVDKLADSFKSGVGLTYDDHGEHEAVSVEQAFGNWTEHVLVPKLVPAFPGLADRLSDGARVADVGCGAGFALRLLQAAYPASTYEGYDPSEHAINLARQRCEETGNEITFHQEPSSKMDGTYDVILTLDCLHDMTRPDLTAADIRSHIADDGVWIIKEIRSYADFKKNRKNPMLAMLYATSVSVCMSSAMSEEGGMGLGTLGLNEEALTELVTNAGFSTVVVHDFEDPMNLYYEVRP